MIQIAFIFTDRVPYVSAENHPDVILPENDTHDFQRSLTIMQFRQSPATSRWRSAIELTTGKPRALTTYRRRLRWRVPSTT